MTAPARRSLLSLAAVSILAAACADQPTPTALVPDPDVMLAVSVTRAVASLVVTPTTATVSVGSSVQLTAAAFGRKGRKLTDVTFSWSSGDTTVATVSSTGSVKGIKAGQATITVTAGGIPATSAIKVTGSTTPPPPPPPPPPASWTYCTAAGSVCNYVGLRDVRLAGPSSTGAFVSQVAFGSVPCASYAFNNQNPAPGQQLHCDYGPLKTTTIANPMPGMGGLPSTTVTVALGAPGAAGPQARWYGGSPTFAAFGAFRTQCSLAKFAFDDPIVYPGQPGASHLHMFFGNTSINASSSPSTLPAVGSSTCRGGTLNRSAYWIPAVVDARTGEVQTPAEATVYYKSGYSVDYRVIKPFPAGLRMIAGDKNATAMQPFIDWSCSKAGGYSATIPNCRPGDYVRLSIGFPQCWDGKNLDAPDHKSHMARPNYRNPPQVSTCPSTHPITLPEITQIFEFPVSSASTPSTWRLASDMYSTSIAGGLSTHADWMNGWDPATMQTIVASCLNKGMDCGVNFLGDGREIY